MGVFDSSKNNFNINTAQKLANLITPVRVLSIILDDSHLLFDFYGGWNALGVIQYEVIGSENVFYNSKVESNKTIPIAFPASPNLKNYPLINEIVYILSLPSTEIGVNNNSTISYYLNLTSLWNHPHHNAYPSAANESSQQKDYLQTTAGSAVTTVNDPTKIFLGKTFIERSNIHPLLPFEGDLIQEGRWGNSVRFGSTVANSTIANNWSEIGINGDPIIIFRNGQGKQADEGWIPITEDINKDDSSIYLTSTQQIKLEPSSLNYVSYSGSSYVEPILPSSYAAPQIILNSGRLVFNSKNDHILLNSAKSINLNSLESINIDTKELLISADTISLGPKYLATEPLLLGNTTVTFLKNLIKAINDLAVELKDIKTEPAYMGPNVLPQSLSVPGVRLKATSLITALDLLNVQLTNLDLTSKRNFTV